MEVGCELDIRDKLTELIINFRSLQIPAVQKHSIDKGRPEKVLTQLGAIRKQLQMEQLRME